MVLATALAIAEFKFVRAKVMSNLYPNILKFFKIL
jgi:hypothetical protein